MGHQKGDFDGNEQMQCYQLIWGYGWYTFRATNCGTDEQNVTICNYNLSPIPHLILTGTKISGASFQSKHQREECPHAAGESWWVQNPAIFFKVQSLIWVWVHFWLCRSLFFDGQHMFLLMTKMPISPLWHPFLLGSNLFNIQHQTIR